MILRCWQVKPIKNFGIERNAGSIQHTCVAGDPPAFLNPGCRSFVALPRAELFSVFNLPILPLTCSL